MILIRDNRSSKLGSPATPTDPPEILRLGIIGGFSSKEKRWKRKLFIYFVSILNSNLKSSLCRQGPKQGVNHRINKSACQCAAICLIIGNRH